MEILPKCFGIFGSKHKGSSSKQPSTAIEHLCHRFSFAELRKATNNFDQSRILGEGGFGKVYKGSIYINGQLKEIAAKRLKEDSQQGIHEFKNEVFFLCQLQHPNLVPLVGFCLEDEKEMIVVYEYMANGTLGDHLFPNDNTNSPLVPLSWKKRLEIIIGAARGLHYLHSGTKRTIIHRDVKPMSILLDENWIPKLSDFGLCLKGPKFSSKDPKPIETDVVGTLGYVDPQYYMSMLITDRSDVYSFGVILVELLCGKRMTYKMIKEMKEDDESEHTGPSCILILRSIVEKGKGEKIMDPNLVGKIGGECLKLYIEIAERCLNEDPNERPAMGEVEVELEHALELQEQTDANH